MPIPSTTRLAAIYARVSTEEQTKGLVQSTAAQVHLCREKAAALGVVVAPDDSGLIVEEQHSGADLRWEGTRFMELVRRAERGDFTDLLCLDVDRFCRGGSDAYGEQKGLFVKAGVTIHYVLTDFGANNPFRGSMEAICADAAQWIRDKAREASVRTRTEWARQGNITRSNIPPFGFVFVEDATLLTRQNRPLVIGLAPDPVTGPALLHITQHVADGGSVYAAKMWLEAQGIPTVSGAPVWQTRTIRRILHNRTNCGARHSLITHEVERAAGSRRPASGQDQDPQGARAPRGAIPGRGGACRRAAGTYPGAVAAGGCPHARKQATLRAARSAARRATCRARLAIRRGGAVCGVRCAAGRCARARTRAAAPSTPARIRAVRTRATRPSISPPTSSTASYGTWP